jgi:hypothetical protein
MMLLLHGKTEGERLYEIAVSALKAVNQLHKRKPRLEAGEVIGNVVDVTRRLPP